MYFRLVYKLFSQNKLKTICNKVFLIRVCYQPVMCFFNNSVNLKNEDKLEWINFGHSKHGDFYQKRPKLSNPFLSDIPLQSFLNRHVPSEKVLIKNRYMEKIRLVNGKDPYSLTKAERGFEVHHFPQVTYIDMVNCLMYKINKEISDDLNRFGHRIVYEIDDLGWECEIHPPHLETYNAWGKRVDELKTCTAWKKQHDISAEEGLVAIAYEQKLGYWSRLHQICKLYLYSPSSGLYGCPLAMTDGAAKTIMTWNNSVVGEKKDIFMKAFNNLTTRDPETFWTSGQWMTEKRGGSDVAQSTETVAVPDNDFYRLYGYKWFSSASDANMALTLARVVQKNKMPMNDDGLTMFYIETKNLEGQLNNIQMVKLKNKLGTRQLPTAELLLDGCIAHKMSDEGRGIASISHMLNITRLHNSVSSVAAMRRMLMLSRDFSQKRTAFGRVLSNIPLHMRILSKMEVETRGSLLLLLKVAILLGKTELGINTADEFLLLRLLSPVLKLYTAKQAVAVTSEGLESFGGLGYIEDTRLPAIFRDAQVLPIWEGTTNVLSMDVIRCLTKTKLEALLSLEKSVILCLEIGKQMSSLKESCLKVETSMRNILQFVKHSPEHLNIAARDIAYSIARSYIGALLIENAAVSKKEADVFTAQQWCEIQELCPLSLHQNYSSYIENDFKIVMEGYKTD